MKKLLFLILLTQLNFTYGQKELKPCGHTKVTNELWAKDKDGEARHKEMVTNLLKNKYQKNKTTVYIIPIVFHIIHEYGTENISDAQVYDQVDILNRDYRKLNPDTASVIDEFKPLIADCQIEFRLPSLDPQGNCTNGIEHIYSHETNNGDDYAKIHQWDRNRYLNVWVVNSMKDGVAGYAYYPSDIFTGNSFADGVIILNDYVGSIGTSDPYSSRALTHEIGHWLGLSHVWGSTNEPGVACGDDDINDTPITKGYDFCPLTSDQAMICNDTIVENYQNYMEYSYCSKMFTIDQSTVMIGCLNNPEAYRDMLVSPETHASTGINVTPTPTCKPVAEFNSNFRTACINDNVQFTDQSWNGVVTSRTWTFQDGSPATATSATATTSFTSSGWKRVTLVVSNAAGSDTSVVDQYIYIAPANAPIVGPNYEAFNAGSQPANYVVFNPEDNFSKWQYTNHYGIYNTGGMYINNFYELPPMPYSDDEFFYNNRLAGNKESLITPAFDLSTTGDGVFSFDYAFATKTTVEDQITENLTVYSSTNCGKTWIPRKSITGVSLLTAGNFSSEFLPESEVYWRNCTFDISGFINSSSSNVLFKFVFTASDYSNNFFIDNIRIYGELGVNENDEASKVLVYPNPATENAEVIVTYQADDASTMTVTDMNGKVVSTMNIEAASEAQDIKLNTKNFDKGCYLITILSNTKAITKKLIIE